MKDMEHEYTKEELDFIEEFIKPCDTGSCLSRIQFYRDKLQRKDLIERYLGKFVRIEYKIHTDTKIFTGLISGIEVSSPKTTIYSKYYMIESSSWGKGRDCIFKNLNEAESITFSTQTTITEITQEEFDEYLITNIISLDNEREETKIT
jgi:hypothetical protein